MSRPRVMFTLDQGIIDELNQLSAELKQKKSHIVEKALTLYFDLMDVKIADKRMTDVMEGKSKLTPLEDVIEELGL